MPRKCFRVKDVAGQWIEVDPADCRLPPIRNESLNDGLIERIGCIHRALQDVLQEDGRPMSLEHFEVGFMRSDDPAKEVAFWEAVVLAMEKSRDLYAPERYPKADLYSRLILMLFGALTDEESRQDESVNIRKCFAAAMKEKNIADSGKEVICYACYKRICGTNPVFCPRCGRKLRQ